ncbi:MAG TPA: hypothetical protein V6C97_12555 [Oculatellaceae cyanobacterium]
MCERVSDREGERREKREEREEKERGENLRKRQKQKRDSYLPSAIDDDASAREPIPDDEAAVETETTASVGDGRLGRLRCGC